MRDRLAWAIARQPRHGREYGTRLFQRRIGTPLSSVQTYLRKENPVTPPLDFVQRAADVLGVRPGWLAFGDGWPTEKEQAAVAAMGAGEPLRALGTQLAATWRSYEAAVRDAIGRAVPGFWELPHAARASALRGYETYCRLPSTLAEFGEMTPAESGELVSRFAAYLSAPFSILRIPSALEPTERALVIEALLRPVDIARWIAEPEGGQKE